MPIVLLTGIATNCTAILNTLDRFALPALAPAVISISVLVGALLLGSRFGIWAMVYATLAGSLLHVIIVAWMMEAHGYPFRLRWHGMNEATREVAGQYGPVLLSSVVASGGLLVDQSMAAMLPAGSVSALVYANRFVSVVLTLLAGAVSTAIVPYFSRMIAHRDWAGCRHTLRTWVGLTALVSIPIAILLIAGARPLVRIAYQHGHFGPRDTAIVASVLAMYAIQIPFLCHQPRLLPLHRRHAPHRSGPLLRHPQPRPRYCAQSRPHALVWRGRNRPRHLALDREHVLLSLVLEPKASGARLRAGGSRMISSPAQYLLRIDDLCPTVSAERWQQLQSLIEEFRLQPILAVVPDNQDPELQVSPPDPAFWDRMRALEAAGAAIGLHGYRHLCVSRGRSLVDLHRISEFAGVPAATQRAWIGEGMRILRGHGLDPKIWVAPRHGFDANTLAALREEGILALSDGFARAPFLRSGIDLDSAAALGPGRERPRPLDHLHPPQHRP